MSVDTAQDDSDEETSDFMHSGHDLDLESFGETLIEMGKRLTDESDGRVGLTGVDFKHEMQYPEFTDLELTITYHVRKDDELYDPVEYKN